MISAGALKSNLRYISNSLYLQTRDLKAVATKLLGALLPENSKAMLMKECELHFFYFSELIDIELRS